MTTTEALTACVGVLLCLLLALLCAAAGVWLLYPEPIRWPLP